MRDRILDGAEQAISRLGLEKVNMQEVGRSAEVSRGTVYRYFPNRESLLAELAKREGMRLQAHLMETLQQAQSAHDQFEVVVRHANWHVREHPVLRQLSETDPAFVLRAIRQNYPLIREAVGNLVFPLIKDMSPMRREIVTGNEAIDMISRVLISMYLIPDPNPEKLTRSISGIMKMLREMADPD